MSFTVIGRSDRQIAAIHEASHAALIRLYGGVASPSVWPTGADDAEMKKWGGGCCILARPGSIAGSVAPVNWRALVGAAGFVGELMFKRCPEIDWLAHDMLTSGDAYLSESDAALIGESCTAEDVEQCIAALAAEWDSVLSEARSIVSVAQHANDAAFRPWSEMA